MNDYIKSLEEQNEELKQKLAAAQSSIDEFEHRKCVRVAVMCESRTCHGINSKAEYFVSKEFLTLEQAKQWIENQIIHEKKLTDTTIYL